MGALAAAGWAWSLHGKQLGATGGVRQLGTF